jgi:hypothetical protein
MPHRSGAAPHRSLLALEASPLTRKRLPVTLRTSRGVYVQVMKPAPWFTLSMACAALIGAFGIAVASWSMMLGVPAPDEPGVRAVGMGLAPWIFAFAVTLACVVTVAMLVRTGDDGAEES